MYGSADTIGVDTTAAVNGDLLAQLYDHPFAPRGTSGTSVGPSYPKQ